MISEKMSGAINNQINAEMYSAYLYLSMAAYFNSQNLKGFANWMNCQAQEEMIHAMKFYNFVNDRGGRVLLRSIDTPPAEWASPLKVFEEAYSHEQKVTSLINNLVTIAESEKDRASQVFLNWFVTEQVEEESSADEIVQKLKLMKDVPGGLYIMDQELAKRVFTMPAGGFANPASGE